VGRYRAASRLACPIAVSYDPTRMFLERRTALKVPEIGVTFWVLKLLTTAMGEATSDFFVLSYNRFMMVALGGICLLVALIIQVASPRYVPWKYWLTVAMVAVFGTMAADALHIQLGVPYVASTSFFAVVLAVVFVLWQKYERTLSIHTIDSSRREVFYWATVLATFALGTAAGDMTATTFGLGYFPSAVVFTALILIPAVGFWRFHMNEVLAFWFAYVLTRPIGASIADWLSKSKGISGLGFGDGRVAIAFTVCIIALVGYLTITHTDDPEGDAAPLR
jgi:uncharacterized membrane-anchored protein